MNRAGLPMEAESGAEVAGSESRADVTPKDGSVGVVADSVSEGTREVRRVLQLKWGELGEA